MRSSIFGYFFTHVGWGKEGVKGMNMCMLKLGAVRLFCLCLAFFLKKKKCPLISKLKILTQVLYAIPAWNKFSVIQLDSSSTRVTMCDPLDIRPKFKGVVISSTSLLAFVAIFTLVGSTSVSNTNIGPYCIYLEQTQELRCNCQNLSFKINNFNSDFIIIFH